MIDVFKMDIESAEWNIFQQMNMDYACEYFKQLHFETHRRSLGLQNLKILRKLDKCFLLFRRDTRFFTPIASTDLGPLTEFQVDNPINVRKYGQDGTELAAYILSTGEFYFVNKNFL